MTTMTKEQLAARVEAIHRQYGTHFAGQPRISRDLSLLEAIIAEIDETLTDAKGLDSGEADALIETLQGNRKHYLDEASEIAQIRNNPKARSQEEMLTWLAVIAGRYRRFFANQPRITRDLGLLNEIAEDAERLYRRVEALNDDTAGDVLASIKARKKVYANEIAAVTHARREASPEHLADHLASMANDQFTLYKKFFLGKSRLSRRPARILRILTNLGQIHDQMTALREEGLKSEHNQKNIGIVADRTEFYQTELTEIQQAKSAAEVGQIGTALAESANEWMGLYRETFAGKERAHCDPDLLSDIIEGLYDLARQMEDLQLLASVPENEKNLQIVLKNLNMYEREYDAIQNATK